MVLTGPLATRLMPPRPGCQRGTAAARAAGA